MPFTAHAVETIRLHMHRTGPGAERSIALKLGGFAARVAMRSLPAMLWSLAAPGPADETTTIFGGLVQVRFGKLRRAVARPLDTELLHPMPKCVWMNVQDFRCALRTINHSIGKLKCGQDMVSLRLVEG